ncbi:uncharacterized protein si:rp71-81e14.2 [Conger conger]|nr:uncharacterized protein si:rp71-81e14.2 [Conger conger]
MATSLYCFILLVFTSLSTWSAEVRSNKQFVWLDNGDSFSMQCSTTKNDSKGLYLVWGLHEEKELFYLHGSSSKLTVNKDYRGRLQTEGKLKNIKIKLPNMTEDDSGVYWCKYQSTDNKVTVNGSMVVVNGRQCPRDTTVTSNLVLVSAISAGSVFLLCFIVLLLWLVPKMEKSMRKKKTHAKRSDSVYEDMRKSNRAHQPTQLTNHFP